MKKIVAIIKPFEIKQKVFVYEDGQEVASTEVVLDELNETILSYAKTYEVNSVDLAGPKKYNAGLARDLEQYELTKYSVNNMDINII